ncbi:transcriptional regulator [Saccharothrix sp. ALI-22-I]|uniref:helix-turn-helix domain-containing protein n=1 Tax=Saccharothrix sp. ALI-22-I TaxID=1933778 RepID=UPI00097C1BB9|nr:helix-turn-helix transcriptional regulator [Saccharothrix sp. ALI-22-I]ONI84528.1 transcriptional regulator [Saccharothrix sp. ALI-22-I]
MDNGEPFGSLLRTLRMARDVSLGELARRTHYSKGYLSKVEMGLRPPSEGLARQCDAALDVEGRLIAAVADRRTTSSSGRRDRDDQDEGRWVMQMDDDGSVWFQPVDRRSVLALGATSLLALRTGGRSPVGNARHEAALTTFGELFPQLRQLGQQASPEIMLPTLITQTQTLQQIATGSGGRTRTAAFTLAARYAEYTGWMAQESGQDPAALWWTERAVRLAAEGGDAELAAYSLVRRALITLYTRDAQQTVELARQAQRHPGAGARVRGLAAQREAQGHALAGSATACLRSLEKAQALLSADEPKQAGPVLGSGTVRNPVGLTTAWCLHDLGRPEEAAAAFERELRAVPPASRRFQLRWRVRQALSYATSGEVDQACLLTWDLLGDLASVDSATSRSDLVALARTLSRWLSHPRVRDLYPALSAALHPGAGRPA